MKTNSLRILLCLSSLSAVTTAVLAQSQPMGPPDHTAPPAMPKHKPEGTEPIVRERLYSPDSDMPWGLSQELLDRLAERASSYWEYATRLTCDETARSASYNAGEAGKEKQRRYAYLLEPGEQDGLVLENRQILRPDGRLKEGSVVDEEPFPAAYAWVFLFSGNNQPYFTYRDLGERYAGFDWVKEIQFRGALAFTDGKDIRQWEGTAVVDAATLTPLEIYAQPANQDDKILAMYRRWSQSFNIIGFRTGPKPLVYRSRVEFRMRRDGLTFPTELRYDTLRAVTRDEFLRVRASTRTYDNYRFYKVTPGEETIGDRRGQTGG